MTASPVSWRKSAIAFTIATALLSIPFHLRPENFSGDDGYFYLQIARNIVQGHGSTFNGWIPTNGYHPLWMLICCLCAFLSHATEPLLQIVAFAQDLLILWSVLVLVWMARVEKITGIAAAAFAIWVMNDLSGSWRFIEADLSLALQMGVLLVSVYGVADSLGKRRDLVLGLLLGFAILARLDLIFFVATILVYEFLRARRTDRKRAVLSLLTQGALVLLVVLPYLAWNFHHYGHFMPVSGAIKSRFPHPSPLFPRWLVTNVSLLPITLASLAALPLLWVRERTRFQQLRLLTAIAAGIHLMYTIAYGGSSPWYFTTGYLCVGLTITAVLNALALRVSTARPIYRASFAVFVLLFFAVALLRSRTDLSFTRLGQPIHAAPEQPQKAFAALLKQRFPAGSRFFMFDAPGKVAYYSGMSITSADGLVQDYQYEKDVQALGITPYLHRAQIPYVVYPVLPQGADYSWLYAIGTREGSVETMHYLVPLNDSPGGDLILRDDHLVLKAPTVNPGFEKTYPLVGIWTLL